MYQEIIRLHNNLTAVQIPHEFKPAWDGFQILYKQEGKTICSVIQHRYSYGGPQGYLEIMGLLTEEEAERDDVVGYLEVPEVFARICMADEEYADKE